MDNTFTPKQILPNIFTTANLFGGFLSIVFSSQGEFVLASWLIFIAAIADALDGLVARLTNTSSKFGVELDSIADVVSFGVAPAFLIYTAQLHTLEVWGLLISSCLLIAGAYRLARFNSQLVGFDKSYFTGLPIPMSAIAVASYLIVFHEDGILPGGLINYTIPLILILSFLMVSKVKYDTLPKLNAEGIKQKPALFVLIIVSIPIAIITNGKALFYVFILVILFGIFRQLFNSLKKSSTNQ
ncbi:MAG TPA: CDP-diacylglycerol--serine O-phosphatidyltransferase [Ignavibacteriaceae bacterium]|jgi:CDP-diacylglycerol--serine O-phosphatidyltransferase|nr:CDP-diacylglycerol--serine O-phosphatidyltransferase [Ignavibacteriaceae bacterium]